MNRLREDTERVSLEEAVDGSIFMGVENRIIAVADRRRIAARNAFDASSTTTWERILPGP